LTANRSSRIFPFKKKPFKILTRKDLLGAKDWVTGKVMKKAGAAVPSANRITLLRDADVDGVLEMESMQMWP